MIENKKEAQSRRQAETEPNDFSENEIKRNVPYIQGLVKYPGVDAVNCRVPNDLKSLQKLVGGYIETISIGQGVILICNEDGKYSGLLPNFYLPWNDLLVGLAIFVSSDDEGNFVSLSEEQMKYTKKFIKGECL